jgi:hypothetical protein
MLITSAQRCIDGQICQNGVCGGIITPTPTNTPAEDKPACLAGGGTWEQFPDSCVDSCELIADPEIGCAMVLTYGCDCGSDSCWSFESKQCKPNSSVECSVKEDCSLPTEENWSQCNYAECSDYQCQYPQKDDGTSCEVNGIVGQCRRGECIYCSDSDGDDIYTKGHLYSDVDGVCKPDVGQCLDDIDEHCTPVGKYEHDYLIEYTCGEPSDHAHVWNKSNDVYENSVICDNGCSNGACLTPATSTPTLTDTPTPVLTDTPTPTPTGGAKKPDLIIESITFSPANPNPGEDVEITVRVKNDGIVAAREFFTHLYIDPLEDPPTVTTPDDSRYGHFVWLIPGAHFDWTYTDVIAEKGEHKIYAWVDRDDEVSESNENNNLESTLLAIDVECTPETVETDCPIPPCVGWTECNYVDCVDFTCQYNTKSDGTTCTTIESQTGHCQLGQCMLCSLCMTLNGADRSTGDADCNTEIDMLDFEIWRGEKFDEGGGDQFMLDWQSDFDCDGYAGMLDFEIWRSSKFD